MLRRKAQSSRGLLSGLNKEMLAATAAPVAVGPCASRGRGNAPERRVYKRFALHLPLLVTRIQGRAEPAAATRITKDISDAGVCFLTEQRIEPGTSIGLDIVLVDSRAGKQVHMSTSAHVVRVRAAERPGWYELAAPFDEITYHAGR